MEKPIVFTNLPLCEELCHILVSIDPYEKKDKSVKSDFQWQLLKTRLLLYSEVNIIATPAAGLLRYIHIVSKKECLSSGSLSALFQKLRLKVESVGALSLPMYEQCLTYNLLVKLSPFWNKVEKYFVEGRYFLMHRGALHAIELNIILKGDMLMLYASPLRLWLREVSLFDLLPSSNIEETLSKPFHIDLHSERQWVHVLPSFKRGHLVYVTNRIPKDSTFEDYQQMRRHWKNTYGYRLPEDDSSAIYVGISFFGNNDFLYPLECVRRGMHMNMDDADVVANFAKAIAAKAAFVCGNRIKLRNLTELQNIPKIKISKRLKWSESGLAELDSELLNKWLFQDDESANMTFNSQNISLYMEQESQMPFGGTLKDGPDKNQDYDNWLAKCSQFIDKLTQGGQRRSFLKANRPTFIEPSTISPLKQQPSSSEITKIEEGSFLHDKEPRQSHTPFKTCFNNNELNLFAKEESVDQSGEEEQNVVTLDDCDGIVFENKFRHTNKTSDVNVATSSELPFKPVFKKKRSHYFDGAIESSEGGKKKVSKSNKPKANSKSSNEKSQKKRKSKKIQIDATQIIKENSLMTSEGKEVVAEMSVLEKATKVNDINSEDNETALVHSENSQMIKTENMNQDGTAENQVIDTNENILMSKLDESPLANLSQDSVLKENKSKINFVSDAHDLPLIYENKNCDLTKKVVKGTNLPAITPKERKKSTILSSDEIENLMFMNQLEKANVPSLCSYLKGKGVPFSRDRKKDILLEKVKEVIRSGRRE